MKRTIKSLIIGLALTAVASGQRSLTLKDIDKLYHDAVFEHVGEIFTKVAQLQLNYADALRKYRAELVRSRESKNVAIIAAIDEEIRNMMSVEGGNLLELVAGADFKMRSFRLTYDSALQVIMDKGDNFSKNLNVTLVEQLKALQSRLTKEGDVEGALAAFKMLQKHLPEDEKVDTSDPLKKRFMVVTKEFGGYATVKSNQKLKLVEGQDYTLVFFAQLGEKELNEHDCLPRFFREEGEQDFKGGDKNKMRIAQRISEDRKVSNAGDGWSKITVKFNHSYNEDVVFGVEFYEGGNDININLRDFSLTDALGKELITKNLNTKQGWVEGEFNTFVK